VFELPLRHEPRIQSYRSVFTVGVTHHEAQPYQLLDGVGEFGWDVTAGRNQAKSRYCVRRKQLAVTYRVIHGQGFDPPSKQTAALHSAALRTYAVDNG
jgi:hypothetical protein